MPRPGVHARRDLALLRPALAAASLPCPRSFERAFRARHREIDGHQDEGAQYRHFMRGRDEEDAPATVRLALDFARGRAEDALQQLARELEAPADEERVASAAAALADVLHLVRDSYSRGHTIREPPGRGPVTHLKAWEAEKRPERAFGLRHALLHDTRFELPFAWFTPETKASDAACAAVLTLLVDSLAGAPARRRERLAEGWARFERAYFLPPSGSDGVDEEEAPRPSQRRTPSRPSPGSP